MRTLKLTIQYLGTRYQGWQVQPHRPTVQGSLEQVLGKFLGEPIRVVGAGRTDRGVHAKGQVASLSTVSGIPLRGILLGANALLPADIRIMTVEEAPSGFHARHDAVSKDYAYRFSTTTVLSPFLAPTVHAVRGSLEISRMAEAASHFLGEQDLTAFCGPEGRRKHTRRVVTVSQLRREPEGVWIYEVSANGFLQHLVRTIVGTLLEVGRGRLDAAAIPAILESKDRRRAGPTAAPGGLTLERVHYAVEAGILATPEGV
ncbi:MAG: tRNA pseudouridine(38-40) synthase TruA [Acidobacteria bacterium]|nr:tRNA pseudouridine(38-40) synthase TruA [Acidobacteriota bacterium]MCI0568605.1 tRNA pseudouridine(38-40) synthase TruA [Acidobacteriota bacterium]